MADLRDRCKRAENLSFIWVVVAVAVQAGWLNWVVSHAGRFGDRHAFMISGIAAMALGYAAGASTRRYIRRLPSDASAARNGMGRAMTKERAASIVCAAGTAPVIWGLVAAGVTDDLQNGTSLGSPYIYVIAALASVAAALAASAFVLGNLRRLPVTPDRPVVPRWPPAS